MDFGNIFGRYWTSKIHLGKDLDFGNSVGKFVEQLLENFFGNLFGQLLRTSFWITRRREGTCGEEKHREAVREGGVVARAWEHCDNF